MSKDKSKCKCGLFLGSNKLSLEDILASEEFEKKYNLSHEAIHFLGCSNSSKHCTIIDEISNIKEENTLTKEEKKIKKQSERILEKFYEHKLHIECVNALRNMNLKGFVMQGFQSSSCIQEKIDKSKKARNKDPFASLNKHEKHIMEILDIKDIDEDKLIQCITEHKEFVKNGVQNKNPSWLFSKVVKNMDKKVKSVEDEDLLKSFLKKVQSVEDEDLLKSFYRYQWYNFNVQECMFEWDTLMIIPKFRTVVNIEVKKGSGMEVLKEAAEQTEKRFKFFKKVFGAILSDDWIFIKGVCMPNLQDKTDEKETTPPCSYCNQHMVSSEHIKNMKSWTENILSKQKTKLRLDISHKQSLKEEYENYFSNKQRLKEEYENLLVGLIGHSSIRKPNELNKLIVDPHDFSKLTERQLIARNAGVDGENRVNPEIENQNVSFKALCYMLTSDQINAVKNKSKFLVIEGDYGTGKTYVLKERAKDCARSNPESSIAYITLTSLSFAIMHDKACKNAHNIMDLLAVNDFKEFKDQIKVITLVSLYDHISMHLDEIPKNENDYWFTDVLNNFLLYNQFDHVFIDELPVHDLYLCKNSEYNFEKLTSQGSSICFTTKPTKPIIAHYAGSETPLWKTKLTNKYNAVFVKLMYNMRNSTTVANLSTAFDESLFYRYKKALVSCLHPDKNVIGPVCYLFEWRLNDFDSLVKAVVKKYFPHPNEAVVFMTTGPAPAVLEEIYNPLKETFSSTRKVVMLPDITFTRYSSDKVMLHVEEVNEFLKDPSGILVTNVEAFSGAQARNVVVIVNSNRELRNALLRAMSFCVVITKTDFNFDLQNCNGICFDQDLLSNAD